MSESTKQSSVLSFLLEPGNYPHAASDFQHLETHISHIFLCGEFAYKLKKAVIFDFVDFSSIEKRKHFCEEEVRLNSRFSPELYLGVVPLSRQGGAIRFGDGGEIADYLVKMRRFEQANLFDSLLRRGELSDALLREAAGAAAVFHRQAGAAPDFGGPDDFSRRIEQVFENIRGFSPPPAGDEELVSLCARMLEALKKNAGLMKHRQLTHVREVHGDLHLGNICALNGEVRFFDGIEFNPGLSHTDVWNDIAFLIMDLLCRGTAAQAAIVWNSYLEESDDFSGLPLLALFSAYRAAVRAKVCCLSGSPAEAKPYLSLIGKILLGSGTPRLIALGGLSGSGKSTVSAALARQIGAVHVRADAVRKHLIGVPLREKAGQDAYSKEMNWRTCEGLFSRAELGLQAGKSVIVDAVFHDPKWRNSAAQSARDAGVSFHGFWCSVPETVAKERIQMRRGDISDADTNILALQQTYHLGTLDWRPIETSRSTGEAVNAILSYL